MVFDHIASFYIWLDSAQLGVMQLCLCIEIAMGGNSPQLIFNYLFTILALYEDSFQVQHIDAYVAKDLKVLMGIKHFYAIPIISKPAVPSGLR